jgi:hypothetical protein
MLTVSGKENKIKMNPNAQYRQRGVPMKKHMNFRSREVFVLSLFILSLVVMTGGLSCPLSSSPQEEKKPDEKQSLISESDLYCSFFIWETELPDFQIIGSELEFEKSLYSDGDRIYVNKGRNDGIAPGQVFLALEVGEGLRGYGRLTQRQGRVRIVNIDDTYSTAVVEKSCGQLEKGNFLVPFEEKKSISGEDLGYDVYTPEAVEMDGQIIFLERGYVQIGKNQLALIDLGTQNGIRAGQQLIVFKDQGEGIPPYIYGNLVVIDSQTQTSTVRVLSCKDSIGIGALIKTQKK